MRVAAQQDIAQVERAGTDFAGRKVEASHVGEDLADRRGAVSDLYHHGNNVVVSMKIEGILALSETDGYHPPSRVFKG